MLPFDNRNARYRSERMMRKTAYAVTFGLVLSGGAAFAGPADTVARMGQDTEWLFISAAEALQFDGATVTLTGVDPTMVMFADRPQRQADTVPLKDLVDAWTKGDDKSFQNDPPNAGITVWVDGKFQVATVEMSEPVYDGETLRFKAKVLEGDLPQAGYETSIFIDGGCSPWDPRC